MKQLLQRMIIVALVTAAYVSFQNCSKTTHGSTGGGSSPQSSVDTQLGGTGGGYDGKIFSHIDPSKTCGDGNKEKSAIGQPNGESDYYLLRKDCQPLNPFQKLPPASVQVLAPDQISYQSELYIDLSYTPSVPATENCIGTGVINGMSAQFTIDITTINGSSSARVVATEDATSTTHRAIPHVQLTPSVAGAIRLYNSTVLDVSVQQSQAGVTGAAQARNLPMNNSASIDAGAVTPTNFTLNMLSCR